MAQATTTTCAHNALGQALAPGRITICRQCGAQIQPSPRAVNAAGQLITSEKQVNANYPADSKPADAAWIFTQ